MLRIAPQLETPPGLGARNRVGGNSGIGGTRDKAGEQTGEVGRAGMHSLY